LPFKGEGGVWVKTFSVGRLFEDVQALFVVAGAKPGISMEGGMTEKFLAQAIRCF
jgi:hypothetical protein